MQAAEAFALAQAEEAAREAWAASHRAVLEAERERLRRQLAQLRVAALSTA